MAKWYWMTQFPKKRECCDVNANTSRILMKMTYSCEFIVDFWLCWCPCSRVCHFISTIKRILCLSSLLLMCWILIYLAVHSISHCPNPHHSMFIYIYECPVFPHVIGCCFRNGIPIHLHAIHNQVHLLWFSEKNNTQRMRVDRIDDRDRE